MYLPSAGAPTPVRAPSQSKTWAPTPTSGRALDPMSDPSSRKARRAIESSATRFVQRRRSRSLEASPLGLNARAERAAVDEPRLAPPASPNVSASTPASTSVPLGAGAALTYVSVVLRKGIQTPLRVKL